MYPVKQSTALTVPIFVHDASGDAVTGLVDAGFTKRISKNGGAFAAMTVTITEMENGWYSVPLSTSHTDTTGLLSLTFTHASSKQVNLQMRVEARILDDLAFPVVSGRGTDVTATGAVGIDWGNVENQATVVNLSATNIDTDQVVASVSGAVNSVTTAVTLPSIPANWITAAGIQDGAIDAATFAAGAIDNAAFNVTETLTANPSTGGISSTSFAAGAINAAAIAASALNGKGDWNIGKTGYSISGAITTLDGLENISAAQVNTEVDNAIVTYGLDHLVFAAVADTDVADNSIVAKFADSTAVTADFTNYDWTTESLRAIRDHVGDGSNLTEAGGTGDHLTAIDLPDQTMNITGNLSGSVNSVTTAVTLPSIPADWITAAGIQNGAIDAATFAAGAINAAAIATGAIDADALATDAVDEIRDAILPATNTALNNIMFLFVAASDHVTPVTGATGTAVTRSIDGGAFGSGTGTLSEVANGMYQYDASAADMNGGVITFRFTGTGGTPGAPDDAFVTVFTGTGV